MKHFFVIFAFVWSQVIIAQEYEIVAVGFYNLENLFDTIDQQDVLDEEFLPGGTRQWSSSRYKDKLFNMARVIAEIGIDRNPDGVAILGLAEIENRGVLEDLVLEPAIRKRGYEIVHYDSPDRRGIDVALFYQPKHFKVIGSQSVPMHFMENDTSQLYTRDILHVHGELHGQELHILVNHWPSRRGGEKATRPKRVAAALQNRHIIDSILLVSPGAGIIVMGDLNDDPINESVVSGIRCKPVITEVEKEAFYNPWYNMYKQGRGTLAYRDAWSLFDQVLIHFNLLHPKADQFYYFRSEIIQRPWMLQTSGKYKGYPKRTFDFDNYISGYSDHFPVVSYFMRPVKQ